MRERTASNACGDHVNALVVGGHLGIFRHQAASAEIPWVEVVTLYCNPAENFRTNGHSETHEATNKSSRFGALHDL